MYLKTELTEQVPLRNDACHICHRRGPSSPQWRPGTADGGIGLSSSTWRKALVVAALALVVVVIVVVRPWRSGSGADGTRDAPPADTQSSPAGREDGDGRAEGSAAAGVVLGEDGGLGVAPVGTPMDATIQAVTSVLGPPDYTGKWVSNYCATGEGAGGALVVWRGLGVLFTDGGVRVDGRLEHQGQRVLWGYQYGGTITDGATNREITVARQMDPGLKTTAGIGLGSTGSQIEKAYGPRAEAIPGEQDLFPGPLYVVRRQPGGRGDGMSLGMDANGPGARVDLMLAGGNCGE